MAAPRGRSPPSPFSPPPPLAEDAALLDLILRWEYFVRGSTLWGRDCSPSLPAEGGGTALPVEGDGTALDSGLAEPQFVRGARPEDEEGCGCW
jgi:hypothetical protein